MIKWNGDNFLVIIIVIYIQENTIRGHKTQWLRPFWGAGYSHSTKVSASDHPAIPGNNLLWLGIVWNTY